MPYIPVLRPGKLREYCDERRWTVEDFADAGGFSEATAYRVLNGQSTPSSTFIAACAALFGDTSLPVLFRFVRSTKSKNTFAPQLARQENDDREAG